MSETSDGPALLIVKGSFAQYGGAERNVVRQLETWLQVFSSIHIATLLGHPDMEAEAARLGIPVFMPTQKWKGDTSVLVRITAASSRAASRAWRAFLSSEDGRASLDGVNVVHHLSGEGSLEAADALPADLPLHVHMLEPRRGLLEEAKGANRAAGHGVLTDAEVDQRAGGLAAVVPVRWDLEFAHGVGFDAHVAHAPLSWRTVDVPFPTRGEETMVERTGCSNPNHRIKGYPLNG